MHRPCALVPRLALPATLLCIQCPLPWPHCWLRPPRNANPCLPWGHAQNSSRCSPEGRGNIRSVLRGGLGTRETITCLLLSLLLFCCLVLGGCGGEPVPHLSDLEPRALHPWLLPCPGTPLCAPHPQPCIDARTHTHTHTHTCTHTCSAPLHKKPAEDPRHWASRFSPQGPLGHLTLAPQERGCLDFGTPSKETIRQEEERA